VITFINSFLSYLLLAIIMLAIIVVAIICGKKARDAKDKKDSLKEAEKVTENVEE